MPDKRQILDEEDLVHAVATRVSTALMRVAPAMPNIRARMVAMRVTSEILADIRRFYDQKENQKENHHVSQSTTKP